ncbi:50S ribosomal protein L6 [Candidatus Comchoanobacter bicostacola]|uniref:50S ribosomal protein L6 n=1 Tax=Candidatus Comchoanobacter bicostacola TaxID=2919598 RepID=A0ABY5DI04_9GAMM|nr:50S ribosomal protein L6 [Candidatus Comchoanobacter bicostacola]UTC24283.1 50S ribosomal protein L6 [Candidatus Comchoanobacter bicostacola]
MSRLANIPISIPAGVTVKVNGSEIEISNGSAREIWLAHKAVKVELDGDNIKFSMDESDKKDVLSRSMLGTDFRHVKNFIDGMAKPFESVLEIHGLGYRAKLAGNKITLALGKSHDDHVEIPEHLEVTVPNEREIVCRSYSKKKLGDFVASVCALRKPDPYKAKGVRLRGRHYRTKKD